MNPYKILGVTKECDLGQLREAFKKIALKTHPDKGGNETEFKLLISSYKQIFKKIRSESSNRDFTELKTDSLRTNETISNKKNVSFDLDKKGNEDFIDTFNSVFDSNRFHDPETDDGYGGLMENSSKVREEIDVKKKITNFKDFNNIFDDQETMNKNVTIYKEPVALMSASSKLVYNELGIDKIDDYSRETNNNKNLGYTDYMKAHTTNKLIDKNALKEKLSFKDIEDIEQRRTTQSFELTEEDRQIIEEEIKNERIREETRQINIRKKDQNTIKHFEKINKIMINTKRN
jgi:curved DNA-binding protein CbpA